MKNFRRLISLLLIGIVVFSLTGCERKRTVSGYYEGSDYVETGDTEDNTTGDSNSADNTNTSGNNSGSSDKNNTSNKNNTSTNKGVERDGNIWKIDRDVKPGASSSIMKNLDFKGKTFRMLVAQANFTDKEAQMIKDFAKKYNCKINVDQVNFEDVLSVLATQISSGKPYDIVQVHGAFFPQIAIANIAQPLEDYISKADLANKYGEQGLYWDAMVQTTTWSNHIYYTVDRKSSYLGLMLYNKLLIDDFGLEDPMELYNKGQWTWDKILEYGKIVKNANQGVSFYDSSVTPPLGGNFYEIAADGKITWLGANTKFYNGYMERRKFSEVSALNGSSALVDNMVAGKTMLQVIEAEKLVAFTNILKGSSAIGKNLNNLGVVPIPLNSDGSYSGRDTIGYAACRGVDPTAAIAFGIYSSNQDPVWFGSSIPALENNKSVFTKLYDKKNIASSAYYFLSTDGNRIEQEIFDMTTEINKGGDIMKLLESYAPTVKSILEYNLEKQ